MALINRLSRLFKADVHSVLDRIEEPVALLQQSVREMEEELDNQEKRLKLLKHEVATLERREQETNEALAQIEDELDICFAHDKDDLARSLIRRKLEAKALGKSLAGKRDSQQQIIASLTARIAENRTVLESTRQKATLFAEETSTDARNTFADTIIRDEDIEVAFLREKQQRVSS